MAKKSYDWVAIKVQFINSSLSIPEFSEKFKIPLGTLKKQVAQGLWLDERSRIGTETVRKSSDVSSDIRAYQLTELDNQSVEFAKKAQQRLSEFLMKATKAGELKALAGAMKDIQATYRLALGASTENQATVQGFNREEWLKKLSEYEREDGKI